MPILFRDFVPAHKGGGMLNPVYETATEVAARASAWIEASGIQMIQMETVVLPNIGDDSNAGMKHAGQHPWWWQVIRVWYREQSPPPLPGSVQS